VRGIVVALALMSGCYVYGGIRADAAMVVYQEPPAPKLERTPALSPGYVWVGGHWESHDNQWMWIGGRTATVRPGYLWNDGRWERRGNAWHWVEGVWVSGATTSFTAR
jgi:hypothetical protein